MSELTEGDRAFLRDMTRQHQEMMRAEMGEYVSQRKLDRERALEEYPGDEPQDDPQEPAEEQE